MTKKNFFLLVILGFCAMWQKADAQITLDKPELRVPSLSFVGEIEVFICKLDNNQPDQTILYQLFKEGNLNKPIGEYSAHSKEEARFIIVTKPSHDGSIICKASVQNNTEIHSAFSDSMIFKVVVPVEGAHIISRHSSEDFWEGDSLTLQCNITKGTYVTYDWFLNNKLLHNDSSNNQLNIPNLSRRNSGQYVCVAKNYFNETTYVTSKSDEMHIRVKEYLSEPKISLKVVKNGDGNFTASVKCQVAKGSLPINFTLFKNNTKLHEHIIKEDALPDYHNTLFFVPIKLDQDMGMVYCKASDGKTSERSRDLNLTVEAVGGNATMTLEHKYIEQDLSVYAVYISCHVRGTFPQYYWFLNNTRLERNGSFYRTDRPDGSLLLVMLTNITSSGVYHCEAANSFDNTTCVSSQKALISHEALNKIATNVVIIIFTFFALLICAVFACCIYGVVLRKRKSKIYNFRVKDFTDMHSKLDDDDYDDDYDDDGGVFEMTEDTKEQEYEEGIYYDLDTESYIEDTQVVQASILQDSDESEEEEEPDFFPNL